MWEKPYLKMAAKMTLKFEIGQNSKKKLREWWLFLRCLSKHKMVAILAAIFNMGTDGLIDGCQTFPYPPLRFAGAGDNNRFFMLNEDTMHCV
jgi:hypothetical protein